MIDSRHDKLPAAWRAPAGTPQAVLDELRDILARYHIPERDAAPLLEESLFDVLYKIPDEALRGPAALCALESACRAYWENRRWRTPDVAGDRNRPAAVPDESTASAPEPVQETTPTVATVHRFAPAVDAETEAATDEETEAAWKPSTSAGRRGFWARLDSVWQTLRAGRPDWRLLLRPPRGEGDD